MLVKIVEGDYAYIAEVNYDGFGKIFAYISKNLISCQMVLKLEIVLKKV